MIEINLLPEEIRKKKHSVAKVEASVVSIPSLPLINVVAWIAGAIFAIQIALFGIGLMNGSGLKSLEREYNEILPKKQETDKLRSRVGDTNKKVAAIDELMVKRFSWEKKLNSLSDSMTPGIWLTELEYDEKVLSPHESPAAGKIKKKGDGEEENVLSRQLILSGAASSMGEEGTALIGRFIKNLKDDPEFYSDFRDIELGTIKREKMEDQEIMTFKITCFFKAK